MTLRLGPIFRLAVKPLEGTMTTAYNRVIFSGSESVEHGCPWVVRGSNAESVAGLAATLINASMMATMVPGTHPVTAHNSPCISEQWERRSQHYDIVASSTEIRVGLSLQRPQLVLVEIFRDML